MSKKMTNWDEAIEHVMRVTGKNAFEAEIALIEKIDNGELPATGIDNTGKRVRIPPLRERMN